MILGFGIQRVELQFFNRHESDCGGFNTTKFAEIEFWTGMVDKNSERIYENDIVLIQENAKRKYFYLEEKNRKKNIIKFLTSQPFIIKFTELKPFVFDAFNLSETIAFPLEKIRDFVFEVVGNIHEKSRT